MNALADTFVVCCLQWGDRYPAEYVNRLARAVAAHMDRPHRFVCFTENAAGLSPAVEALPLPSIPLDRSLWNKGIWPKLGLFANEVLPPGTPVLYLDLDVLILGDLTSFADRLIRQRGLWIIREWNPTLLKALPLALRPDRGGNSSAVAWIAGEQTQIYDAFCEDPERARAGWRNDQQFITAHASQKRYWPHRWCGSFKRHCVWFWPVNLVFSSPKRPRWCSVLVFHGKPDPTDLLVDDPKCRWGARRRFGYGPVKWVQEYWQEFDS